MGACSLLPTSVYALVLDNLPDMVALHGVGGAFEWVSPGCNPVLGYDAKELVGKMPWVIADMDDARRVRSFFNKLTDGGRREGSLTFRGVRRDGRTVWLELGARVVRHPRFERPVLQSLTRDVDSYKLREEQLQRQLGLDNLTRLPNRTLFMRRVEDALFRVRRGHEHDPGAVAVLFIDFDDFKGVNDTYGHLLGDSLLQAVARRLVASVRPGDTVSRFGGDEFLVLLDGLRTAEQALSVVERIREGLSEPFVFQRSGEGLVTLHIAASIGIAAAGADGPVSAEQLVHVADDAMYAAKQSDGQGSWVFAGMLGAANDP